MLKLVDHAVLIDQGSVLIEGSPAKITADESAKKTYFGDSFH